MKVGLLTLEQKNEIVGQQFAPDSYFYPIQDNDNNWIISIEEIDQCTNYSFQWIKNLPLINHNPKIIELD